MIWHFFEVWLLLVMTLIVGCVLGAYLYGVLADSRFAIAQGTVADGIGDAFDGIKLRLGVGPAWRPKQMSAVARPLPPVVVEPEIADAGPDEEDDGDRYVEAVRVLPPALPPREERRLLQHEPHSPPDADRPRPRSAAEQPETAVGDPVRVAAALQVSADGVVPMRPAGVAAPRGGVPDNLTRIKGIGHRNEELLNSLGVYHFGQIAAWTPGEVRWIGQYLAFPERIERDDWVGQATLLASGVDTGFQKSAERRRQRRRELQQERQAEEVVPAESAAPPDQGDVLAEQVRAAKRRPIEPTAPVDDDWSIDAPVDDEPEK